jgi:hypothetical protein
MKLLKKIFKDTPLCCDVSNCEDLATHRNVKLQVIFLTEQNEGRGTDPYFSDEVLDLCSDHHQQILREGRYLHASGAMGQNTYFFAKPRPGTAWRYWPDIDPIDRENIRELIGIVTSDEQLNESHENYCGFLNMSGDDGETSKRCLTSYLKWRDHPDVKWLMEQNSLVSYGDSVKEVIFSVNEPKIETE